VVVVNTNVDGAVYGNAIVLTQDMFGVSNETDSHFGYRVATGYFLDDGYMDIAVGTPTKDLGATDAGMTHVILGGPNDIGRSGYFIYGQDSIGDVREANDNNGFAVTFGAFDATDQGTLVIGVPGEDGASGQVHVVAPWRQFYYHTYKTAFVTDCQGQIIYSRKPFERVFIASTTKILTVLLACEHSQLPPNDPLHISFDDTYTVPDWVADDIGGSTADLETGEVVTLRDLVHMALLISGNDAAHAIGDMLHGAQGVDVSIPQFVAEMNDRAAELGMFDSHFNNANGFEQEAVGPDFGDHYSTAYDMEILSRAAMANPLFREIARTLSYSVVRPKPEGVVHHTFDSFQTWILENEWGMTGSGLKGGFTPAAQTTWCTSVEGGVGRAIATTFGTPEGDNDGRQALELLTLGLGDCAYWQLWEDWEYEYLRVIGMVAHADERDLFSLWPGVPRNMQIELFHATAQPDVTDAFTQIHRQTQVAILPQETIDLGIAPFSGAADIKIQNMEDRMIRIWVQVPEDNRAYNIPAHGTVNLYLPPLGQLASFPWTITSSEEMPTPVYLSVDETYLYSVDAPAIPTTDPIFSVELFRNARTENDLIGVDIHWWLDGGAYKMIVHDPEFPVSSAEDDTVVPEAGSILRLSPPAPNPFSSSTRLGFTLLQAADVSVSIHDVSGRRVRHYPAAQKAAGVWSTTWDGKMDDGGQAPPGSYFYRVVVDGAEADGGKLVRVR
ncbi:MAG: hypothetical protein KC729_16685, partial [Candidatus Eisenbacteria bacterium]|nr:hypothetical protein [Candidatus Eisenbacteria bacterium]